MTKRRKHSPAFNAKVALETIDLEALRIAVDVPAYRQMRASK